MHGFQRRFHIFWRFALEDPPLKNMLIHEVEGIAHRKENQGRASQQSQVRYPAYSADQKAIQGKKESSPVSKSH
jgi:hypothetical protein